MHNNNWKNSFRVSSAIYYVKDTFYLSAQKFHSHLWPRLGVLFRALIYSYGDTFFVKFELKCSILTYWSFRFAEFIFEDLIRISVETTISRKIRRSGTNFELLIKSVNLDLKCEYGWSVCVEWCNFFFKQQTIWNKSMVLTISQVQFWHYYYYFDIREHSTNFDIFKY